ncbi:hypothetical protein, partial [Deinococcus wulumuqiensis]|uniref:hypothetical protein n=1 Tax=Deinococcus wulumuqiensis TaxID=980427 RepID=UPI00243120A8
MTLPGLFLCAALFYAAWTWLGGRQVPARERPDLLGGSLLTLILPALLTWYTFVEYPLWAHLTFPFSLLAWAALLLVALTAGLIQLARGRRASGWPLLGLPAAALGTGLLNAAFSMISPLYGFRLIPAQSGKCRLCIHIAESVFFPTRIR